MLNVGSDPLKAVRRPAARTPRSRADPCLELAVHSVFFFRHENSQKIGRTEDKPNPAKQYKYKYSTGGSSKASQKERAIRGDSALQGEAYLQAVRCATGMKPSESLRRIPDPAARLIGGRIRSPESKHGVAGVKKTGTSEHRRLSLPPRTAESNHARKIARPFTCQQVRALKPPSAG
jgi:hypothetical protein